METRRHVCFDLLVAIKIVQLKRVAGSKEGVHWELKLFWKSKRAYQLAL